MLPKTSLGENQSVSPLNLYYFYLLFLQMLMGLEGGEKECIHQEFDKIILLILVTHINVSSWKTGSYLLFAQLMSAEFYAIPGHKNSKSQILE